MDLTLNEISQIVDKTYGKGALAEWFVNAFSPVERRLKTLDSDKTDLSINDIFIGSRKKKQELEKRYEKTLGRLMGSLRSYANALDSESGVVNNIPKKIGGVSMKNLSPKERGTEFIKGESITKVHIQSVDRGILDSFKKLGSNSTSVEVNSSEKSEEKKSGVLGKLFAGLIAVGSGVVGVYALKKGFQTDGSLKGTLKMVGIASLKFFTGFMKTLFSAIPNFIDNVGKRLVKKYFDLAEVSKLLKSNGITKGLGGIKNLRLMVKKLLQSKLSKHLGKFSKLFKIGSKVGAKVGLKQVPFGIGTIASFFFAYSRFKSGDVLGGLMEMASGLATFLPIGVGNGIALGIDAMLATRDLMTTREQRKQNGGFNMSSWNIGDWSKKLWNWVKKPFDSISQKVEGKSGLALVDSLMGIPLIGPVLMIAKAYEAFKKDDMKEALLLLGGGLNTMAFPWAGLLISGAGGVQKMTDFFKAKRGGRGLKLGNTNFSGNKAIENYNKRVEKVTEALSGYLKSEFEATISSYETLGDAFKNKETKISEIKANIESYDKEMRSLKSRGKVVNRKEYEKYKDLMGKEKIELEKQTTLLQGIHLRLREGNQINEAGHAISAQASMTGSGGGNVNAPTTTIINTDSNLRPEGDDYTRSQSLEYIM